MVGHLIWHFTNTTPEMPAVFEETFQTASKYNGDITKSTKAQLVNELRAPNLAQKRMFSQFSYKSIALLEKGKLGFSP